MLQRSVLFADSANGKWASILGRLGEDDEILAPFLAIGVMKIVLFIQTRELGVEGLQAQCWFVRFLNANVF